MLTERQIIIVQGHQSQRLKRYWLRKECGNFLQRESCGDLIRLDEVFQINPYLAGRENQTNILLWPLSDNPNLGGQTPRMGVSFRGSDGWPYKVYPGFRIEYVP